MVGDNKPLAYAIAVYQSVAMLVGGGGDESRLDKPEEKVVGVFGHVESGDDGDGVFFGAVFLGFYNGGGFIVKVFMVVGPVRVRGF